jgi:hypothetical protein
VVGGLFGSTPKAWLIHAFEPRYFEQERVQPVATPDDPLAFEQHEDALVEPLPDNVRFGKVAR